MLRSLEDVQIVCHCKRRYKNPLFNQASEKQLIYALQNSWLADSISWFVLAAASKAIRDWLLRIIATFTIGLMDFYHLSLRVTVGGFAMFCYWCFFAPSPSYTHYSFDPPDVCKLKPCLCRFLKFASVLKYWAEYKNCRMKISCSVEIFHDTKWD